MGNEMMSIRVGLCGAVHPNMPGDDRGVCKRIVVSMEKFQKDLQLMLGEGEWVKERVTGNSMEKSVRVSLALRSDLPVMGG